MPEKSVEEKFKWKNVGHQYYAAISANLIFLSQGAITGWISPILPLLLSDETPLKTGPLTTDQVSSVGSMTSFGAVAGTFMFGYFTTKFGCKRSMTFLTIPSVIYWLAIYFGDSYYHLLFARLMVGWSAGGVATTVVLYVAEIANDEIRGTLGTICQVARNAGILLAYIVGAYFSYEVQCIFVLLPIAYSISVVLLPNTPQYYLKYEQFQKAEKSLKYYKGYRGGTKSEEIAIKSEFERLKSIASDKKADKKTQLRDFFERDALKGLCVGIMLAFLTQITGCFTFITYAVFIFQKSGSHIDSYVSSIVIGIAQLVGCLFSTQLADTLGRKPTMLFSILGCSVGLLILSAYLYLMQLGYDLTAYAWLPVTSLSFVIFIASAGVVSLNGVCTVENLPSKIRDVGLAVCTMGTNVSTFVCVKYFPILGEEIGLHGCMLIFGMGSLFGGIYILFAVNETKGTSMDVVNSKQNTNERSETNIA